MTDLQPLVPRRLSRFTLGRQWRLIRKELAETLRDRRTIVTLVLMPILVYPLLSIVFRQFLLRSVGGETIAIIGVDDEATRDRLAKLLVAGDQALREQAEGGQESVEPPLVTEPRYEDIRFDETNVEMKLRQGQVDVVVRRLRGDNERAAGPGIEIEYLESSPQATGLRSFIERRLRAFNAALRKSDEEVPGVSMVHKAIVSTQSRRSLLPSVVPLVLLLMTITGAVYPAIDLTAGERERGTLEALIAAPVSRLGVLFAKYVAVLTVALLTAGVNLTAMTLTLYGTGLMTLLIPEGQSPLSLIGAVLGLLLLFASFFSAVLLTVTSFAKSFKEAQAYLIPLMLVTLGPGLLSLSPTLELTAPLTVTPLMNVVLLARDVFSGGTTLAAALAVVVSTMLYAAVAIAAAARVFGSDAILYGSGGSWTDVLRRSQERRASPSMTAAWLAVAVAFAGLINLGAAVPLLAADAGAQAQITVSAAVTALVFAGVPLLALSLENVPLHSGLRIRGGKPAAWAAALLLGVSLGLLVSELTLIGQQAGWFEVSPALREAIAAKAKELQALPFGFIVVALAVVPAIAEELFFRGYLLRALEDRSSQAATVALSALLFALFHVFGASGITLERALPSLLLGIVLGWLALRSGSVLPGMLLHAMNNGLLLWAATHKEFLVEQGWISSSSEHWPPAWIAAAVALSVVGLLLVALPLGNRRHVAT
jgi:ABC-2 type transport system permease protein/sodium transport system permease protein